MITNPVARELAKALADKVADAISGFPASTNEERAQIADSIAAQLAEYADHQRGQ